MPRLAAAPCSSAGAGSADRRGLPFTRWLARLARLGHRLRRCLLHAVISRRWFPRPRLRGFPVPTKAPPPPYRRVEEKGGRSVSLYSAVPTPVLDSFPIEVYRAALDEAGLGPGVEWVHHCQARRLAPDDLPAPAELAASPSDGPSRTVSFLVHNSPADRQSLDPPRSPERA